jgi:thiol-disulfide isomerase/thioredoxin
MNKKQLTGWCWGLLITAVSFAQPVRTIGATTANDLVHRLDSLPQVQVVNFWSTLCQPCVQEIPYYLTVVDSFRAMGYPVYLSLVSLDFASYFNAGKVHQFVEQKAWWSAQHFWLNEQYPDEYVPKLDSAWFGALPATKIVSNSARY